MKKYLISGFNTVQYVNKKVTKLKPIANNFSESLPVYVTDLQLTRGNIPVEAEQEQQNPEE